MSRQRLPPGAPLPPTRPDTSALTGLRGVAALWVAVHHFAGGMGHGAASRLIGKGYLAVDLFFVLSGFVLALNHAGRFREDRSGAACLAFYRRRIERVYPLLLVALGMTLALDGAHGSPAPAIGTLAANLAMVQAWYSIQTIVPASWSVSTELFAYLCFPWIAAFALRRGPLGLALTLVGAWACLAAMTALDPVTWFGPIGMDGPLDIHDGRFFPLARCLAGFVAGVCAWRLAQHPSVAAFLARPFVPEAAMAAVVVLAGAGGHDVAIVMLLPLLVGALAQPGHYASALLRSRLALTLGALSYPLYLCHLLIGGEVRDLLVTRCGIVDPTVVVAAACAASLAVAAALHHFVERPCHAFLARRAQPSHRAASLAA